MLWYNLSSHRVGGKVGQKTLDLPPNSKTLLDAPADRNEDYNVKIGYVPEAESVARPLCETTWLHDPRSRNLLFVIPVPGSRAPRIMGFPDFGMTQRRNKFKPTSGSTKRNNAHGSLDFQTGSQPSSGVLAVCK